MIDEVKWNETYLKLCMKYLNMNEQQAERHFKSAADFDRGYSPIWYISEELNCGSVKRQKGKSNV